MTHSDRFMILGFVLNIILVIGGITDALPEPTAWFLLGTVIGCIVAAALDAVRRFFDLW